MPIKAVIFDLDGTLVDSLPDIASAANHALTRLGFPTHDLIRYRMMIGDGADILMQRALPSEEISRAPEALKLFKTRYADHMIDATRPFPGIPAVLDALTAKKIPMAILSNKPHEATCRMTEQILDRWHWSFIAGHRTTVPKKPDPAGALEIARILNVPPDCCAFIGDSANDVLTGSRAGMIPVGVRWGYRDEQELQSAGAQLLAHTPADLLKLLNAD